MIRIEASLAEIEALLRLDELEAKPGSGEGKRLAEARAALAPALVERFDGLRAHAHGPALPMTRPSHCPACHIRLSSQLESKLRGRTVLLACPHCRRLLFQLPAPAAPTPGEHA
jgi:predicted  nucleic acid-binding Zn-ribbon protein